MAKGIVDCLSVGEQSNRPLMRRISTGTTTLMTSFKHCSSQCGRHAPCAGRGACKEHHSGRIRSFPPPYLSPSSLPPSLPLRSASIPSAAPLSSLLQKTASSATSPSPILQANQNPPCNVSKRQGCVVETRHPPARGPDTTMAAMAKPRAKAVAAARATTSPLPPRPHLLLPLLLWGIWKNT